MPLEQGITPSKDTVSRSTLGRVESDGRTWNIQSGTWSADGTRLTTSTGRGSDPKIYVYEPYSDFDVQADVGFGDALYLRYKDNNNWLRVTKHRADYSTPYNCNQYFVKTGTTPCNEYTCYYVSGYQACNQHGCGTYYGTGNYYACGYYDCSYYYTYYYYYSCNCTENGSSQTLCAGGRYCASCPGGATYSQTECYSCGSGCYFGARCPSACYSNSYYACSFAGYCWLGNGTYTCQSCQSDPQTGYQSQTCTSYCQQYAENQCWDTCAVYSPTTCWNTCDVYEARYETCYNYYYPVYLRLEKMVGGTLTLVQEVGVGDNVNPTYLRVTGKGSNIQVFSSISPTTAHINQNVTDNMNNNGYGVGRIGYGNIDSGNALDNITIKPFGQPG